MTIKIFSNSYFSFIFKLKEQSFIKNEKKKSERGELEIKGNFRRKKNFIEQIKPSLRNRNAICSERRILEKQTSWIVAKMLPETFSCLKMRTNN